MRRSPRILRVRHPDVAYGMRRTQPHIVRARRRKRQSHRRIGKRRRSLRDRPPRPKGSARRAFRESWRRPRRWRRIRKLNWRETRPRAIRCDQACEAIRSRSPTSVRRWCGRPDPDPWKSTGRPAGLSESDTNNQEGRRSFLQRSSLLAARRGPRSERHRRGSPTSGRPRASPSPRAVEGSSADRRTDFRPTPACRRQR